MKLYLLIVLLLCTFSGSLWAQLCNGSLGDPVVHIDFGKGPGPGPPLKSGVTNYSHVSIDCPQDGFYTLHNSISNCHGSSWHTVPEDHTAGDANGYYMLVNASFTPGDFFVDTIRGLCTNTTYEFAAWITNVLKPGGFCGNGIDPDLTFAIETLSGTVLAKQNSGNITESPVVVWSQYGVYFKTPLTITDVVVRITNNAPGGCGNDLALDDITFRPCGPSVNAIISSNGKDTALFCEGNVTSLNLAASYSAGYANPSFQWQESIDTGVTWKNIPGAITLSYTRPPTSVAGSYRYRMLIGETVNFSSSICRTASNTIAVNIYPLPVISMSPTVNGCENSRLQLTVTGGSTYAWTGPGGFISSAASVTFAPLQMSNAGFYSVIAVSDKGCQNSGSTSLTVFPSVNASVSSDITICEGTSTSLLASGGSQYTWTPSKGLSDVTIANPQAQPADSTMYKVIVKNQFGCSDTAQVAVNIWRKPVANAGPDKRTKAGTAVQIDGSIRGFDISYYWTPSSNLINPASLSPTANPAQSTTYTLHAVSGVGCGTSSDEMELRVYEIPNAFSPNGDGTNDLWLIRSPDAFAGAIVEVYNRYGQIVYRSIGYSKPWNGTYNSTPVPVGTYYYVIDLRSSKEPNITGWILIVR
ncbi:MAG: gliding motility-associated C-terminal domain-containing protein [Chitinophagaceae bacterium]|nr:gliding motility-associated C-terminal domain-containing protein [Chitinophagaceae bacterium]